MNHDTPVSITRKASAAAPAGPALASAKPRAAGGFWAFLRTLFIGSAGLALFAVLGTLAGSAWLTANQRAEADKPQPWADPSFTTTAVTTGGMLARFMDNDGDLSNGHSYIKGIYDLWKVRNPSVFVQARGRVSTFPQLWTIEFNQDLKLAAANEKSELERLSAETKRSNYETLMNFSNSPGK